MVQSLLKTSPRLYALSRQLYEHLLPGRLEPEVGLLGRFLAPGQRAVDVGANSGLYSAALLKLGLSVVGFEPNPAMVAVLRHRFAGALRAGTYRLETCVLAAEAGRLALHVPDEAAGLASVVGSAMAQVEGDIRHITVPARRMDEVIDTPVDFIKIDVEGFEEAVVAGAARVIADHRPALLIECEERHNAGALNRLTALLAGQEYRGVYWHEGRLHPLAAFDVAVLQQRAALNPAGTHRTGNLPYINNFLFLARPEQQARLGV